MADVTALVRSYFDAIRARDADALSQLFTADAVLVSAAGTFRGRNAIASFYRDLAFLAEDLEPREGALVVEGDRVAVEIELRMGGAVHPVADFFTIRDGLVERLVIYSGSAVPTGAPEP